MKGKIKQAFFTGHNDPPQMIEYDADIFGPVAVSQFGDDEAIFHVETGYRLSRVSGNKRKIRRLARLMNEHADAFTDLSTTRNTKRNQAAAKLLRELWAKAGLTPY